ncbi:tyrosine-type recombinase/integrase [Vreelandella massiliensis]|uniref:tyrosine-type recombinase/integrase n=1 Tax=Vreelandella massiliensis TaxID=1816686 RepID=UPI00096AA462|nr:tyrosine-type recombinase/integrase [Halomonas massiliensis]
MGTKKAITTPAEVSAFALPEGRLKARRAVKSKHGAGLSLEARAGKSTKLWMYRFNLGGQQREMMLGSYPAMTLKRAREEHATAVELVKKGLDPRKQRASEKANNLSAWTMRNAFERWIEHYQQTPGRKQQQPPTAKTVSQQRGRWRRNLAPLLADFYVRDVSRRLIIDVLEQASKKGKVEARHSLNLLRQLLRYCQIREQIEVNPTDGLTPSDIAASASPPRKRYLSLSELHQLWQAIDDARADTEGKATTAVLSIPVANALKLLILTGARRGEVASMRWDEIKKDIWTIPAERTKSRRQHQVYLSPLALKLLDEQRHLGVGEFVFASTQGTGNPIHPDSLSTTIARLQGRSSKEHNVAAPLNHLHHFTVHDLRRSFATQATEVLMADPFLVETMLAHAPPKLIGTYNHAKRWKSQVIVWLSWGELIAQKVASSPTSNANSFKSVSPTMMTSSESEPELDASPNNQRSAGTIVSNSQASAPPDFITFIDIEASGLKQPDSYPIEIGWADTLGNSDAFLICPLPQWTYWDEDAESLHGITREQLQEEGVSVDEAVKRLEEMLGVETVFCDALAFDGFWLDRLFKAAGIEPSFQLADVYQLYGALGAERATRLGNIIPSYS